MSTLEFNTTYSAVTGEHVGGLCIPTLEADSGIDAEGCDVLIDGMPDNLTTDWRAITGKTGQYGYSGAVMHPSETADDDIIREWVREAGGDVFAIVEVFPELDEQDNDDYSDESSIGWVIIYRPAED